MMRDYIEKLLDGALPSDLANELVETDAQLQRALTRLNSNPKDEQLLQRTFLLARRSGKRLVFKEPSRGLSVSDVNEIVDVVTKKEAEGYWTKCHNVSFSPKRAPDNRPIFVALYNVERRDPDSYKMGHYDSGDDYDYWLADELAVKLKPIYYVVSSDREILAMQRRFFESKRPTLLYDWK